MSRSSDPSSVDKTLVDWLATGIAEDVEPDEDVPPPLPRLRLSEVASKGVDLHLKDVLGVGGMAVVTRAEQRALGRDVAVKRSRHAANPKSLRALLREAWITGQLDHPNVVPVHLVGETEEGEPVVVLRAIGGESWSARLESDPADDPDALARHLAVFVAVCNAAHYAHEQGFLHRDIKPANVQIGSFGEVYLLDWGVAAPLDQPVLQRAGTPAYMAPEMLDRSAPDRRSDVFLLGATLSEAVSGDPPRGGVATSEILQGARDVPPLVLPDHLPTGLRPILQRATAPSPDQRFPTALALRDAVLAWQVDASTEALLDAAEARLDAFESAAGAAVASPDDEVLALEARERFAAARFGFEQVLAERPEHPGATSGLCRGLEGMIRVELAHGGIRGARALLAAHPAPDPALASAIELRAKALDAEDAEQARLARVASRYDTSAVARDFSHLVLATVGGIFVGIVGTNLLFGEGLAPGVRSVLLLTPMTLAIAATLLAKRTTLWVHPVGRRLSLTIVGVLAVMIASRASQLLTGADLERFAIGEPFLLAAWLFGSAAYLRTLFAPAAFCLVGASVNAQLVGSSWSATSQNVLILSVASWSAWLWWRALSAQQASSSEPIELG